MKTINSELLENAGHNENKVGKEENLTLREFMHAINQDFDIKNYEGFKRFADELSQDHKAGFISEEAHALLAKGLSYFREDQREAEAIEIDRIFGKTPLNIGNSDLIFRAFDRINNRSESRHLALLGVYLLGYIYGIRAERKRRKEKETAINKKCVELFNIARSLEPVELDDLLGYAKVTELFDKKRKKRIKALRQKVVEERAN